MKTETFNNPLDVPFNDSKKILVQIFTSNPDAEYSVMPLLKELKNRMPHAAIIGTSSDTLIENGEVSKKDTVISVTIMEHSYAETIIVENSNRFHKTIRSKCNALLRKRKDRKLAIVFGTTFIGGDDVIEAIKESDKHLLISGGLAIELEDELGKKSSFVFNNEGIVKDGFVMAMLYGEKLNHYSDFDFNWIPLGHKFIVTKSDGAKVFELDNTPIKDIYTKYLGKDVTEMIEKDLEFALQYPIIIENSSVPIARAIIDQDEDSFTYAGFVKEGETVCFGFYSPDSELGYKKSEKREIFKSEVIFTYSCKVRRSLMRYIGEDESKKYSLIAKNCGFYTYGEFFNYKEKEGSNAFLNQSFTVLGLREKDALVDDAKIEKFLSFNQSKEKSIAKIAMHHFAKTVTDELNNAVEEQVKLVEEEKELRKVVNYQASKRSLEQLMEVLKDNILYQTQQVYTSIMDIYFKNNIKSLSSKDIEKLKTQTDIVQDNIKNILEAFSEATGASKETLQFSLPELFKKIHTIFSLVLVKKNIKLIPNFIDSDTEDLIIKSKKVILHQAILPIVLNAIESIERNETENGEIIMTAMKKDNGYTIEISDNGTEIKENIEQIFNYDFSSKKDTIGLGLELYLAKNSIETDIKGEISVENNIDSQGVTIKLYIPNLDD